MVRADEIRCKSLVVNTVYSFETPSLLWSKQHPGM